MVRFAYTMSETFRRVTLYLRAFAETAQTREGKITLAALASGTLTFFALGFCLLQMQMQFANADNVATQVTVLNTPPTWVVEASETGTGSATSTPSNAGTVITWTATGDDSSGDNYYLIICKTSDAPTAGVGGGAPSCGGGIANQWAISASTVDNTQASAATTTKDTFPFNNEKNDWWAWICDANTVTARCLTTDPSQGEAFGDNGSPFVINHVPVFAALSNDSPEDPGGSVTWTTTSYDNDSLGGSQDTVQIFVCQTNGFATSTGCTGARWATSTPTTSNAATTTDLSNPMRDGGYAAYVFLMDNHGLVATSTFHGFNSSFVVNNMTPTVSAATISLEDTDGSGPLTLATPSGQTSNFKVRFTVSDDNSCVNQSSGNEISSAIANIYRSGVGQASCDASGEYNANQCYANASPLFSPHISCVQDPSVDACSGATDATVGWTCTFSLWYTADPTDGTGSTDTQYFNENWLASVQVGDDNFSTSTLTESSSGNEMTSFLAFDVTQSVIGYESLEPGQNSTTLGPSPTTTDLIAQGNIGLDEDLYGDTMCPTSFWTAPDSCDTDGFQSARDVPVSNQKFATSSVAYGSLSAISLTGSSTPTTLLINVPKTTSTSSPETRLTHWGIAIPGAITTAGAYEGQNTITAKKSDPAFW